MLTKVEIDGYRLLNGFTADLRPLTVVIGANAVGKSTLLDSLNCISECLEWPLSTVLDRRWGMVSLLTATAESSRLSWKITFTKPTHPAWDWLPLEGDRPLLYEVVLRPGPQGQPSAQYEVLRTPEPLPGFKDPFKFLESTPFGKSICDRRTRQLVPFDESAPRAETVCDPDQGYGAKANDLAGTVQEPTLMLSQIRFFNDFPIPSAARFLLASMAVYPGFDVTPLSNLRTRAAEIRPIATLLPSGENLGTVLHEILTRYDYRSSANELREFLGTAYPSFEEIHCDTTFGRPAQVLVRLREKGMGRSMELWELPDGMLRFLCLAAALLNPLVPPLVALDEPELGLHPRLLPIVADMIKTASERTQVLITTHSPQLLDRFDVGDIAVMARAEDEPRATWHRPADRKTLVQMLRSVAGETLGELLVSGELEAMQ